MNLPDDVRDRIRDLLWGKADELGWLDISDAERSRYYEQWTREAGIGGTLAHYMDARKVRVYIKDSLLKPYARNRVSATEQTVMKRLDVGVDTVITKAYIKPHGCAFRDGRIITWGNSRDWKLILMAMHERAAMTTDGILYGVVLIEGGKTATTVKREIVRDAARKLGIERLEWLD
jgi:hypothetical protein